MGLCGSITALAGITRRCSGLWRFLVVRAQGRAAVELERERNHATAEVIQLLPDNCELLEYEPMGRLRIIRKLGPATTGPATAEPAVAREMLSGQSE
jgi:hypothetical protein